MLFVSPRHSPWTRRCSCTISDRYSPHFSYSVCWNGKRPISYGSKYWKALFCSSVLFGCIFAELLILPRFFKESARLCGRLRHSSRRHKSLTQSLLPNHCLLNVHQGTIRVFSEYPISNHRDRIHTGNHSQDDKLSARYWTLQPPGSCSPKYTILKGQALELSTLHKSSIQDHKAAPARSVSDYLQGDFPLGYDMNKVCLLGNQWHIPNHVFQRRGGSNPPFAPMSAFRNKTFMGAAEGDGGGEVPLCKVCSLLDTPHYVCLSSSEHSCLPCVQDSLELLQSLIV